MTSLYQNQSGIARYNAQKNLMGRTHYVDPDTLQFHKSRIISARAIYSGMMFAIVESVALDFDNRTRGYRYVIFDLFGHVVDGTRLELADSFKSSTAATTAMWAAVNKLDARAITEAAMDRETKHFALDMDRLRHEVAKLPAPLPPSPSPQAIAI